MEDQAIIRRFKYMVSKAIRAFVNAHYLHPEEQASSATRNALSPVSTWGSAKLVVACNASNARGGSFFCPESHRLDRFLVNAPRSFSLTPTLP